MLAEHEPNAQVSQRKWVWSDCKLVLRRTNPKNPSEESYENLQAEVELESDDIQQPFIPSLKFRKELKFSIKKGFYWKKNVPLPPLIIKLQKSYLDLLKQDEELIMIYCDLTIAYPRRKDSHFYLQQIRTQGENRKKFTEEGQVLFDEIVLKQSSLQKQKSKFSFLITICASSFEENRIILKTLISTAFYSQPNRIIRKNKMVTKRNSIKMLSPSRFLKPFTQFKPQTLKNYNEQEIIDLFKNINSNSCKLSKIHPLYLIYHFYGLINAYQYDSQNGNQSFDINELDLTVKDKQFIIDSHQNRKSIFSVKKTKKIRKINKNRNGDKKKKYKQFKIYLNQALNSDKNYILITLNQQILNAIKKEINQQDTLNQSNNFKQELEKQIIKMKNIFQKWNFCRFKVDLLNKDSMLKHCKIIEKPYLFQTYRKLYQKAEEVLKESSKKSTQNQKITLDLSFVK